MLMFSSLLPRLPSQHGRTCTTVCRVLSKASFSEISSSSTTEKPSSSPHTHLESRKGHLFRKTRFHQFQTNTSIQKKIKEKSDMEVEFEAMESAFDQNDVKLGLACLKVGLHLEREGKEPEKTLDFGVRALKVFDRDDKESLNVAMALRLMGSACYSLKRFNDGLVFLDRADKVLGKLESEGFPVLYEVQVGLANTKTAMGRREEALINHRKCLELREMSLEPNSMEVGVGNRDLAEAYVGVLNFKEALPHCLKALEIQKVHLGDNSVEVAHERRRLAIIYMGLGEHQNALDQNVLSRKVLKNWGLSSELLYAEIDGANIQIALGKYDEAVNSLKGVVQQTEKESTTRALVFIAMANALCNMERFVDSKRCLEISSSILDKKEQESPKEVAEAYMEIALLYEAMNEFETEITLMKRSLDILEKFPQEQHAKGSASARLGWLLLLTGKVPQAVPYLESAAETIKESLGSNHFGLGYVYNNLGAAYLELNRPQSAAQMFAMAKEIMDVSLGPHHADSIDALQNLSKAHGAMGSYAIAMKFQRQVINAWESHGPKEHDEFREAHRVLEQLRKKALGASSCDISIKALPLPRAAECVSTRS